MFSVKLTGRRLPDGSHEISWEITPGADEITSATLGYYNDQLRKWIMLYDYVKYPSTTPNVPLVLKGTVVNNLLDKKSETYYMTCGTKYGFGDSAGNHVTLSTRK